MSCCPFAAHEMQISIIPSARSGSVSSSDKAYGEQTVITATVHRRQVSLACSRGRGRGARRDDGTVAGSAVRSLE